MEAAIQQWPDEGTAVKAEDVARLSPLVHTHINFQGRYSFALPEAVAQGQLRPLHAPDELETWKGAFGPFGPTGLPHGWSDRVHSYRTRLGQ